MGVIETERLVLRRLDAGDAPFILRLLNEPSFLEQIGDRGVRTVADAERYIHTGPVASYERFGFGLWLVVRRADDSPIGICGLLRRDGLEDPDVGFAFVPESWRQGYAFESAAATLAWARDTLGLSRVAAITSPGNVASIALLGKLGFRFERMMRMPAGDEVRLFARTIGGPSAE